MHRPLRKEGPKTDPGSLSEGRLSFSKVWPRLSLSETHLLSFGCLCGWSDCLLALARPLSFMPSPFSLLQHWSCTETWQRCKSYWCNLMPSGVGGSLGVIGVDLPCSAEPPSQRSQLGIPRPRCDFRIREILAYPGFLLQLWTTTTMRKMIIAPKYVPRCISPVVATPTSLRRATQNKLTFPLSSFPYIWKWFSFKKKNQIL